MSTNKPEVVPRLIALTTFPDGKAATKQQGRYAFNEMNGAFKDLARADTKDGCVYIKLAEFGDTLTDKNCLRHDANVVAVSGCEIDYDSEIISFEDAVARFTAADVSCLLYTSASHTTDTPRWRVMLPFSKDITGTTDEMRAARKLMVGRADGLIGNTAAGESYTLSQSYYFGVVGDKDDAGLFKHVELKGRYIDECNELAVTAPKALGVQPPAPLLASTDPNDLQAQLAASQVSSGVNIDAIKASFLTNTYHNGLISLTSHFAGRGYPLDEIIRRTKEVFWDSGARGLPKFDERFAEIASAAQTAFVKFGKEPNPSNSRFNLTRFGAMKKSYPKWLFKKYIEEESLNFVYGESEALKTFIVLDMACCAATGQLWGESPKTKQGSVIYLCGEAQAGIQRRIAAWEKDRNLPLKDAPLFVSNAAIDLSEPESRAVVQEAVDGLDVPPVLIVIDTFSRHFSGDENSNTDFNKFIAEMDVIKAKYGCAIVIVHHTGKNKNGGLRGASSMRGVAESIFRVDRIGDKSALTTQLHCQKVKDGAYPNNTTFKGSEVDLGKDEDGDSITSLALNTADARLVVSTDDRDDFLLLTALGADSGLSRKALAEKTKLTEGRVKVRLDALTTKHFIEVSGGTRNTRRDVTALGLNWVQENKWFPVLV